VKWRRPIRGGAPRGTESATGAAPAFTVALERVAVELTHFRFAILAIETTLTTAVDAVPAEVALCGCWLGAVPRHSRQIQHKDKQSEVSHDPFPPNRTWAGQGHTAQERRFEKNANTSR
jgi:hypothetical protein